MKRIITCFVIMVSVILSAFSQIPQTFSYQAVVRDSENNLVAEKKVVVHVQILQGSDDGSIVYTEKHVVTTNQNGLMTFELGGGETNRNFSSIDWSKAPYFIRTITDVNGQIIEGVTPVLAVPYALYAAKAGNAEVDLSEYYHKAEIDYKLERINAQIEKLDSQLNPPIVGFSVADNKQVMFSSGNLQYRAFSNTWRFAEHQWDYIGTQTPDNIGRSGGTVDGSDNMNISSTYGGWIDLFGWGTSGYNGCKPYYYENYISHYPDGNSSIAETNYDWGVYNTILNGGNNIMWRTLTYNEWRYLLQERINALEKYGLAIVNNVEGLVLLPDDWRLPKDLSFSYGGNNGYEQNRYSATDWKQMEANGAIFLPTTGIRQADGTTIMINFNGNLFGTNSSCGSYWTSSGTQGWSSNGGSASSLVFSGERWEYSSNFIIVSAADKTSGRSVRLVHDIK